MRRFTLMFFSVLFGIAIGAIGADLEYRREIRQAAHASAIGFAAAIDSVPEEVKQALRAAVRSLPDPSAR